MTTNPERQTMGAFSKIMAGIRRLRIRMLYNRSFYSKARSLSMKELASIPNHNFAVDIILRSFYNEQNWSEVISFSELHPSRNSNHLSSKAESKLFAQNGFEDAKPKINSHQIWDSENLLSNWYQEENRLWFRYPKGWVFWDMPNEFSLIKTHESLLNLAMNILLQPLGIRQQFELKGARPFGKNAGLAYSGGVDSTAAAILLPQDTILSYHHRTFPSELNHELAERLFDMWEQEHGRSILRVPSNHELIRTSVGMPTGFSTDFAAGVHLVLLSDALDLGTIAFGTPIDNTWLLKGAKFRDFSESTYWVRWKKYFSQAGLHLEFPINHISEAGAMKICKKNGYMDYINSCLRGDGVNGCGKCWKCFNKNGPLGRKIQFDSHEIQTFLSKSPMPTAQHALWAIQVQKLEQRVPHLASQLRNPLTWWEGYYPPGLDLIGQRWRAEIETNTKKFLQPMVSSAQLEKVDIYPQYSHSAP